MTTALTVSGTGDVQVLIKYTDGGNTVSFVTGPTSSVYLDDTMSDYRYKVISGTSVTVSASGISFSTITSTYAKLEWDFTYIYSNVAVYFNKVVGLVIGGVTYDFINPIDLKPNGYSIVKVSDEIFKLNNPNITPTSYSQNIYSTTINNGITFFSPKCFKSNLILNIEDLTDDIYLKLLNSTTSCEYLVKTTTATQAVPVGYTEVVSPCYVNNNL